MRCGICTRAIGPLESYCKFTLEVPSTHVVDPPFDKILPPTRVRTDVHVHCRDLYQKTRDKMEEKEC